MSEPNNPHDGFFKVTFSDKYFAGNLIKVVFPKPIVVKMDFDTLEIIPGSFITPELQEFFSDIVYECDFGKHKIKISLLFEHKSYPPDYPHLQLLRYMNEAWLQALKNEKPLQVILPIIVYHGKRKWKARTFKSYFEGIDPLLYPYIPSFDYLLTDLQKFTDEEIMAMNAGLLVNTLLLFKHYGEDDYTRESIEKLFVGTESFVGTDDFRNKIISFIVYLWTTSKIKEKEFGQLLKRLPEPIKEATMTTYEQIIRKGELKGKLEGKLEKENLVIKNAYEKNFDLKTIAELTGLSIVEVQNRITELGL